jgi:hypothetical protein
MSRTFDTQIVVDQLVPLVRIVREGYERLDTILTEMV